MATNAKHSPHKHYGTTSDHYAQSQHQQREQQLIESNRAHVHKEIHKVETALEALKEALRTMDSSVRHPDLSEHRNPVYKHWLGRSFTKRLLVITVVWQIIVVGVLSAMESLDAEKTLNNRGHEYWLAGLATMTTCQMVLLALISASTVKLAKQLLHHTATGGFLVQSFLSTIFLYAGIYTLLHQSENHVAFHFPVENFTSYEENDKYGRDTYIAYTFLIFLYFSVQTISSVGFGDISPASWYTMIVVTTEMLVGVFYMVAILGRSMDAMVNMKPMDRDDTLIWKGPSVWERLTNRGRGKGPSLINNSDLI